MVEEFKSSFYVSSVLAEDTRGKSVALCGSFGEGDKKAVIVTEKQPIDQKELTSFLSSSSHPELKLNFKNDIYSQYEVQAPGGLGSLKMMVVYPATEKHVMKYTDQEVFVIKETPEDYARKVKPYIESQALSLQWVDNILKGISEADRLIYNDEDHVSGFVILPDLKWNSSDLNSLYLIAIVRQAGLYSVRDLRKEHVPLLRDIQQKGKAAAEAHYGVSGNQLRFYIHYHPSYYHFHVHITHVKYDAPGCQVGRSILLDDVIENLEIFDDEYYCRKTLTLTLRKHDPLFKILSSN
ncbi:PREDICTED: m7GpppX diphosphatase-like [Amphimedon queenslandica]|uniref:m7GpppX diphosphatase n=1 Tax=Amphimedon queenslandica TaxID=400682 RepID=A0A1X7VJP6_AMPQE|nr:PREDICTED: m7GpppX diphosphatase-like [Amphimedon queenslandica]|eukprot:XP_003384271.1 PREDICTED: m7GpppX diphosphatase-like [Amphimedon queenslandica]